ncbi:MAG: cupin domain-containing protein [Gemmatimonadetes bacterium]|nr:cupin domain-containing protein [Gemmatimonadota bacterium]
MGLIRSLNWPLVATQESVMAADYFIPDVRALARFTPDQITKTDCFRSERLFTGINCLARGQSQKVHTHDGADKFYLVLSGKARIVVGAERRELSAGAIAWAPAGLAHGIDEALEDSVVLVVMSPPPGGGK